MGILKLKIVYIGFQRSQITTSFFFYDFMQDKNVHVWGVIWTTKDNVKINHSLLLTTEELDEKEHIENGRTYIVKRIPMEKHRSIVLEKRL